MYNIQSSTNRSVPKSCNVSCATELRKRLYFETVMIADSDGGQRVKVVNHYSQCSMTSFERFQEAQLCEVNHMETYFRRPACG